MSLRDDMQATSRVLAVGIPAANSAKWTPNKTLQWVNDVFVGSPLPDGIKRSLVNDILVAGAHGKPYAYLPAAEASALITKALEWYNGWAQGVPDKQTAGQFVSNAASVAGKIVTAPVSAVGTIASKLPIVGGPISAALNLASGPLNLVERIASGERIDKAVMGNLKDAASNIRTVGPYAQAICSMVPGIGTAVSAGIGIGMAAAAVIAEGQPITQALKDGVVGALPGGALSKVAANLAIDVAEGKNVADSVVKAGMSQLPPDAQTAVKLVSRVAQGENVSKAVLDAAMEKLTPELKNAITIGTAVGMASSIQLDIETGISIAGTDTFNKMVSAGQGYVEAHPILKDAAKLVPSPQKQGYNLGVALLSKSGVNENYITLFRGKLSPENQKGFDIALAAVTGMATAQAQGAAQAASIAAQQVKYAPQREAQRAAASQKIAQAAGQAMGEGMAKARAAYLITQGMKGAPAVQKKAMLSTLVNNSDAKVGVTEAAKQIVATAKKKSFWQSVIAWFTTQHG